MNENYANGKDLNWRKTKEENPRKWFLSYSSSRSSSFKSDLKRNQWNNRIKHCFPFKRTRNIRMRIIVSKWFHRKDRQHSFFPYRRDARKSKFDVFSSIVISLILNDRMKIDLKSDIREIDFLFKYNRWSLTSIFRWLTR